MLSEEPELEDGRLIAPLEDEAVEVHMAELELSRLLKSEAEKPKCEQKKCWGSLIVTTGWGLPSCV